MRSTTVHLRRCHEEFEGGTRAQRAIFGIFEAWAAIDQDNSL